MSHENGPRPKCLNKRLSFGANGENSFSIIETDL